MCAAGHAGKFPAGKDMHMPGKQLLKGESEMCANVFWKR